MQLEEVLKMTKEVARDSGCSFEFLDTGAKFKFRPMTMDETAFLMPLAARVSKSVIPEGTTKEEVEQAVKDFDMDIEKAAKNVELMLESMHHVVGFGVVVGWENLTLGTYGKIARLENFPPEMMNEEILYDRARSVDFVKIMTRNQDFAMFALKSAFDTIREFNEQKKIS